MSMPATADSGLAAGAMLPATAAPRRRRRRSGFKRATVAMRDYAGTGAFLAMLIVCVGLVVLSR